MDKALKAELKAKPDATDGGLSPMIPLAALGLFMVLGLGFVFLQMRKRKREIEELEELAQNAGFNGAMERSLDLTTNLPAVMGDGTVDLRGVAGIGNDSELIT